jgi:hypothetical protein
MSGKVAEIKNLIGREELGSAIGGMWDSWNMQRQGWLEEKKELRNYLFATDTSTTSNKTLPWKNSTTIPKLCQLRDNLHSNYISAMFSNEEWAMWQAGNLEAANIAVKQAVTNYIKNKIQERNLRQTFSQLVYDYIDYGNAFAEVVWVYETRQNEDTGEDDILYVGPDIIRISPLDIVFNPTAPDFKSSPKIRRYVKSIGELEKDKDIYTDHPSFAEALKKVKEVRGYIGNYKVTDVDKAAGFSVDGFGSLYEYYSSGYVELLEFEGDIYDTVNNKLLTGRRITVVDRSYVALDEPLPSWFGTSYKLHVGWRLRQDNLYAMGPLDNLVGMQYRIDHLENAKADAMDLAIHPPLGVSGNVEEFSWGPGEVIDMGDDGNILELGKSLQAVIAAQNDIQAMENKMEEMAGAPRQAMGIRTPGEKTAFEVQTLENAAGRIFQEKVNNFEINLVEPALNMMLELARRKLDHADVVRVIDDEFGVEEFITITKEDITAKGKLRAMGSRHFAARAQLIQNVSTIFNSSIGVKLEPHTSAIALASLVEDVMGLQRYQLFRENVGITEQVQSQQLLGEMEQQAMQEASVPVMR